MLTADRDAQAPIVGREPELATVRAVVSARRRRARADRRPGHRQDDAVGGRARARARARLARARRAPERGRDAAAVRGADRPLRRRSSRARWPRCPRRSAPRWRSRCCGAEPAAAPPEPGAIALGFLNTLRALADDGPLLMAIDDVQWLDAASGRRARVRGAAAGARAGRRSCSPAARAARARSSSRSSGAAWSASRSAR